ncbi:MAG: fused MFS/spermidine synthase [Acidobacteriota bacterium]|nr:fused MFS/spermidine synthase [Acidobacteriota bacterium]
MNNEPSKRILLTCALLFLISGAAALIYEVLWMKELSLLFGNSAQAAAAVLAAFFAGLAAGNRYWGARAHRIRNPLKAYALLEVAVAAGALLYFLILWVYNTLYGWLFDRLYDYQFLFVGLKFTAAFLLLFPATFFMGGTLPVMAQFLIRNRAKLGKRASQLYAINTIGAAGGVFAVGFILPQRIGYDMSYAVALGGTLFTAICAAVVARKFHGETIEVPTETDTPTSSAVWSTASYTAVVSGLITMMLQVLWIRMFAQVLHNSVYTFSAILVTFLAALAVGGVLAGLLARQHRLAPETVTVLLLSLGGVLAAASPLVFFYLTDGIRYLGGSEDFWSYIAGIFAMVLLVVGLPVSVMGAVFPYLFKMVETGRGSPGDVVGRLVTLNTLGGIAGSLLGGFFVLSFLGLWSGIRLAAGMYLLTAFAVVIHKAGEASRMAKAAPLLGFFLLLTLLDSNRLPIVRVDPIKKKETLLKVWEDSSGTVAVIRRNNHLATKLNNWYTLGSTGDVTTQEIQTHLPMLLHPNPKDVFYLGMGTGITAGTALDYPVEKVVVAEVAPAVITASQAFFEPYTNGLFHDARVRIAAEDGRNYIRGTHSTFDLIISDLFIPWKAGTGSLYSIEHYRQSLKKLNPGGLYAQWIPLYQVTDEEYFIIAKTMCDVFPQVTLWRGNYHSTRPVVALIGHTRAEPLSPPALIMERSRQALELNRETLQTMPVISQYVGLLDKSDPRLTAARINTDAHPIIEHIAPINHRLEKAGKKQWFVEDVFLDYMADFLDWSALENDVYLSALPRPWLHAIQAGYYFHSIQLLTKIQHEDVATVEKKTLSLLERTRQGLLNSAVL